METKKFLVLITLWLIGFGVNAADLIERTAPTQPSWAPKFGDVITLDDIVKEPAEFEVGQLYVLYNTGKQLYFSQGCAWSAQAAVDELPIVVRFSLPDGKTLEDQALLLNDYNLYTNKWNLTFFDTPTGMFTDRASQPNIYWNVIPAGDKVYRLQASPLNPTYTPTNNPGFVGYDEATTQGGDTHGRGIGDNAWALSPFLNEDITHHIDWVFYKVNGLEPWHEYFDGLPVYEKAVVLKELIAKAEDAGIDVTAAVAVYNNLESTVADFDVVIKQLEDAIKDNIANATGQHPQDASSWIVNGTFNTVGNFEGWSTDKGKFGAGGTTSTNAEVYGKGAFDINQDITVKYPGLYVFGVKGFYRAGSPDESYKRFSENSEDARLTRFYVTAGGNTSEAVVNNIFDGAPTTKPAHGKAMASNGYWIPNTMADANEFFHADNLYSQFLPVEISGTDVTARIGVKKDVETSYNAWSIFDDFTLIYCGSGEDRYVGYAKTMAKAFPSYDNLTGVTESYKTAYLQLKNNPTGTNSAEAEAYIQSLLAAKAALELNITLWKTYEDSVAYALTFVQQFIDKGQAKVPAVSNLNSYLQGRGNNATKIIAARELTNEQIREELNKLRDLIANVKATVDVQPGTDMTDYLLNPAFDTNSWDGWTRVVKNAGNCAVAEQCAEAWNTESFDIYQEVENMPVGVYEISVQGFYRYGRGQDAFNKYNNNEAPKNSPTYIYMNANTTSFMNVFAEPRQISDENFYLNPDTKPAGYKSGDSTFYFPDNMASAARAFANNMFVNSAYGAQVDMNDKMRLGVKGSSNQLGDSWVIFDNFKLTFWGKQADKVLPALDGAIAEMEAYLTDPNLRVGANITTDLANAIGNANEVRNTKQDDGEAMFDALVALYAIKDKVRESEALLNNLALVADTLKDKLALAAMPVVLYEATNLLDEIGENLQQRKISDSDVPGLIDQLHTQMANADKCINLRACVDMLNVATINATPGEWLDKANALYEEVAAKIEWGTLQFSEINDYINQINHLLFKKSLPKNMDDATDENPVDATVMLKNPNFSMNSIYGWTVTGTPNFGNDDIQKKAYAVEFFHGAFDIHQDIYGLPAGMYEVRCNAFGGYDAENIKDSLVFYGNVLLKDKRVALNCATVKNILDGLVAYGDSALIFTKIDTVDQNSNNTIITWDHNGASLYNGEWKPASIASAVKFFKLPNKPYANSVFVKIEEGQVLSLGVETKSNQIWSVMDDFQLIYYGANSSKKATGNNMYKLNFGVKDPVIYAGNSTTAEIELTNSLTNLVAFQMDLTLPEGVGIDKTGCKLSSRIIDENQELTIGKLESGAYRITSTSLSLKPITGYDGTLFSLKLTAEDDCIGGQATISNVIFSTDNSLEIAANNVDFDINVMYKIVYKVEDEVYQTDEYVYNTPITPADEPTKEGYTFSGWSELPDTMPNKDLMVTGHFYLYGDVNTDEAVNVVDVVDIARFVVATPSTNFREKLADLNLDNRVNIADAVVLVNHIAGDQNFARAMTPSKVYNYDRCQLQLLKNETSALSICLDGVTDFTAFQFDVELPENINISSIRINGQRKDGHQLLYNKVVNNRYRVSVLSLSNAIFKGNEGELLSISIDGQPTDKISVDNILFVTKNGAGITFDRLSLSGTVTGIVNVHVNEGYNAIFDLQGRRLSKVQRGVNIVNGQKVVIR